MSVIPFSSPPLSSSSLLLLTPRSRCSLSSVFVCRGAWNNGSDRPGGRMKNCCNEVNSSACPRQAVSCPVRVVTRGGNLHWAFSVFLFAFWNLHWAFSVFLFFIKRETQTMSFSTVVTVALAAAGSRNMCCCSLLSARVFKFWVCAAGHVGLCWCARVLRWVLIKINWIEIWTFMKVFKLLSLRLHCYNLWIMKL